jgi:hypothetical protein
MKIKLKADLVSTLAIRKSELASVWYGTGYMRISKSIENVRESSNKID